MFTTYDVWKARDLQVEELGSAKQSSEDDEAAHEKLAELTSFCQLANCEIRAWSGIINTCILSTATVCEVLAHFSLKAEPLRVTAGLFHDDPKKYGCVLGSPGDGTRQPAAKADHWNGHLVSIVENRYLIDTTLDQVNTDHPYLGATPIVIDLQATEWFQISPRIGFPYTGLMRLFPDVLVRYQEYHNQKGFRSASDFRARKRREIVGRLIYATTNTGLFGTDERLITII